MGNLATPEFLIARWGELCRDPALEDLPYKIELNAWIEEKTRAYLQAGAQEVWIVAQEGTIRYFTVTGEHAQTAFPVAISLPPPIK